MFAGPPHCSHCKKPHLMEWTLRAWGWGEPPTNYILHGKPTPRSNFYLMVPALFSKYTPSFGGVDPTGPGLRVSPPEIKFSRQPTPRSNFCLLAPTQFSTHIPPFGWVDPADPGLRVSPPEIKFCHANPPRRATLVFWPPPNS